MVRGKVYNEVNTRSLPYKNKSIFPSSKGYRENTLEIVGCLEWLIQLSAITGSNTVSQTIKNLQQQGKNKKKVSSELKKKEK